MSFLDSIKNFVNNDFAEAISAGCVLVAAADGHIDTNEKQKMMKFMEINPNLKSFKMADIIAKFTKFANNMEFDFEVGKLECLKSIEKLKNHPDQARTLVAVCIAIGKTDGDFSQPEINAVKLIISKLGLSQSEFDLSGK